MVELLRLGSLILNTDDFYIKEMASGLDELIFNLSIYDENYSAVVEEAVVFYEQPYLIKAIDAGKDTAKVKCQLNLDELKATMMVNYSNGSATLTETVDGVLPAGWQFVDSSLSTIRRTIEGNYTPLEVITEAADVFGVVFRYDVKQKRVTAYRLSQFQPLGAFATRDLNMTEINYKGKSSGFYTRLYAYGKDGLTFADINDGKPYVDCNTYTDKVICAYWSDDRYTDPESLLEDAQASVNAAGVPSRSYECTVYDLAATNPELYGFQDFSLFSVIRLIDDIKGISVLYQVVEYWRYPFYPEKNMVTLSATAPKIQNQVQSIRNEIENPSSAFWATMNNAISNATDWITGTNGGYVILRQNASGQPYELLIMDTPDIATATKVWRWNQGGLGYSSNGYNGPYEAAITQDGSIVANFITTGTMQANVIKGGTLTLGGVQNGDGVCHVYDADGNLVIQMDNEGLQAYDAQIIGPSIVFGDPDGTNVIANTTSDNGGIQFTGTGKINFRTIGEFRAENAFSSTQTANRFIMSGSSSPSINVQNYKSDESGNLANQIQMYQTDEADFLYLTNYSTEGDMAANGMNLIAQGGWNAFRMRNFTAGSTTLANSFQLSNANGTADIQLVNYTPGSDRIASRLYMSATSSSNWFTLSNFDPAGNERCGLYFNQNGTFKLNSNTGGASSVYTDTGGNLNVNANNSLNLVSQTYYVVIRTNGVSHNCVWKTINGETYLCAA